MVALSRDVARADTNRTQIVKYHGDLRHLALAACLAPLHQPCLIDASTRHDAIAVSRWLKSCWARRFVRAHGQVRRRLRSHVGPYSGRRLTQRPAPPSVYSCHTTARASSKPPRFLGKTFGPGRSQKTMQKASWHLLMTRFPLTRSGVMSILILPCHSTCSRASPTIHLWTPVPKALTSYARKPMR